MGFSEIFIIGMVVGILLYYLVDSLDNYNCLEVKFKGDND